MALAGALFVVAPPDYQAESTVLVSNNPDQDPAAQIQGDADLMQTVAVARAVMNRLGLHETVARFVASYRVIVITDRVLQVTAAAPTASAAVARANALVGAFLQFRAGVLQTEQRLDLPVLRQKIVLAEEPIAGLTSRIIAVTAEAPSAKRTADLKALNARLNKSNAALGAAAYNVTNYPALTQSMIDGSQVLDPAEPIPPSRKHLATIAAAAGLAGGLTLGLGLIAVQAVASNRLRRRDDIARALGSPVGLSVGKLRVPGWLPGHRRLAGPQGEDMHRLVTHLRGILPDDGADTAALTIVPVENAKLVAAAVAALAVSCAKDGRRVVLADLSHGALAGRLLGASDPGVRTVRAGGDQLTVAIPKRGDLLPTGPIRVASMLDQPTRPDKALAAACASADLLVSMTTALDPAAGGDYLATWTSDVAVVVTSGRSSAMRLRAVGEMVKTAGLRLVTVVLIKADKTDETLGVTHPAVGSRRPAWI